MVSYGYNENAAKSYLIGKEEDKEKLDEVHCRVHRALNTSYTNRNDK